jgi:hypothetical protein
MAQASQNVDVLGNSENIKILGNVLKTNVAACTSIGSFFLPQIGRIFLDMLGLYRAVSGIISETVARDGMWDYYTYYHFLIVFRRHCDEDTEDSSIEDGQERNLETDGDLHPSSSRP